MYHIGIDLGGTKIAAGVVTREHQILCKSSVPTDLPRSPESLADAIQDLAMGMLKEHSIHISQIESQDHPRQSGAGRHCTGLSSYHHES